MKEATDAGDVPVDSGVALDPIWFKRTGDACSVCAASAPEKAAVLAASFSGSRVAGTLSVTDAAVDALLPLLSSRSAEPRKSPDLLSVVTTSFDAPS